MARLRLSEWSGERFYFCSFATHLTLLQLSQWKVCILYTLSLFTNYQQSFIKNMPPSGTTRQSVLVQPDACPSIYVKPIGRQIYTARSTFNKPEDTSAVPSGRRTSTVSRHLQSILSPCFCPSGALRRPQTALERHWETLCLPTRAGNSVFLGGQTRLAPSATDSTPTLTHYYPLTNFGLSTLLWRPWPSSEGRFGMMSFRQWQYACNAALLCRWPLDLLISLLLDSTLLELRICWLPFLFPFTQWTSMCWVQEERGDGNLAIGLHCLYSCYHCFISIFFNASSTIIVSSLSVQQLRKKRCARLMLYNG